MTKKLSKAARRASTGRGKRAPDASQVWQRVAAFPSLPDEALVAPQIVAALMDCSVETVKRRVRAGLFPPPIALTTNTHRWSAGVVREALAKLAPKQK